METFNRFKRLKMSEIIDLKNLIEEINSSDQVVAREKLLKYINSSLSPRTRSFLNTPQEYLNTLVLHLEILSSPNEPAAEQKKQLDFYKHQYILAGLENNPFHPHYDQTKQDKVWGPKLRKEKANFDKLEKEAQRLYGQAINHIDPLEKEKALVQALKCVPIGGNKSLLILKTLTKVLLGYSVGKNATHVALDVQNKKKLKEAQAENAA